MYLGDSLSGVVDEKPENYRLTAFNWMEGFQFFRTTNMASLETHYIFNSKTCLLIRSLISKSEECSKTDPTRSGRCGLLTQ